MSMIVKGSMKPICCFMCGGNASIEVEGSIIIYLDKKTIIDMRGKRFCGQRCFDQWLHRGVNIAFGTGNNKNTVTGSDRNNFDGSVKPADPQN